MSSVPFEYIDSFLERKNLRLPNLKILEQDVDQYKTIAFQYCGDVELSTENGIHIGSRDKELALIKFNAFFVLAVDNQCQLAVTPEYSCPWSSINHILSEDILPQEGDLWILGCESILPAEFKEFIDTHTDENYSYVIPSVGNQSRTNTLISQRRQTYPNKAFMAVNFGLITQFKIKQIRTTLEHFFSWSNATSLSVQTELIGKDKAIQGTTTKDHIYWGVGIGFSLSDFF